MFHPLAKIIFKTQYIGRENVPKTGSLIIASNHRNSYDPGLIAAARVRKIHYMAKLELFNLNKLASWMLRHLNAFPVSRGTGDQRSLNYAIRLVEEGKVLGIFPEARARRIPTARCCRPRPASRLSPKPPIPMFCRMHLFRGQEQVPHEDNRPLRRGHSL